MANIQCTELHICRRPPPPPPPLYIRYLNTELLSCDVLHLGNQKEKKRTRGSVRVNREVRWSECVNNRAWWGNLLFYLFIVLCLQLFVLYVGYFLFFSYTVPLSCFLWCCKCLGSCRFLNFPVFEFVRFTSWIGLNVNGIMRIFSPRIIFIFIYFISFSPLLLGGMGHVGDRCLLGSGVSGRANFGGGCL